MGRVFDSLTRENAKIEGCLNYELHTVGNCGMFSGMVQRYVGDAVNECCGLIYDGYSFLSAVRTGVGLSLIDSLDSLIDLQGL